MSPLPLAEGDVHLWFLPRDEKWLDALCGSGASLLSTDERQRLGLITNAAAARRLLLGRILIRRSLARYLNADPRDLIIALGPHGKPALAHPVDGALAFNLSHTRQEWVLAVSRGGDIGVDLEALTRAATVRRIAERWFSSAEADRIAAQGDQAAGHALMLWTLKESVVKALGRTMGDGLSGVQFEVGTGAITWRAPPPEGPETSWSVMLGCVRDDHCLALAVKLPDRAPPRLAVSCHVLDAKPGHAPPFRLLHATVPIVGAAFR